MEIYCRHAASHDREEELSNSEALFLRFRKSDKQARHKKRNSDARRKNKTQPKMIWALQDVYTPAEDDIIVSIVIPASSGFDSSSKTEYNSKIQFQSPMNTLKDASVELLR
jgi:hypothetical protein